MLETENNVFLYPFAAWWDDKSLIKTNNNFIARLFFLLNCPEKNKYIDT